MATAKQRDVGRRIVHHGGSANPDDPEERRGEIEQILASQFAYRDDDGNVWLCLFSEDWRFEG